MHSQASIQYQDSATSLQYIYCIGTDQISDKPSGAATQTEIVQRGVAGTACILLGGYVAVHKPFCQKANQCSVVQCGWESSPRGTNPAEVLHACMQSVSHDLVEPRTHAVT